MLFTLHFLRETAAVNKCSNIYQSIKEFYRKKFYIHSYKTMYKDDHRLLQRKDRFKKVVRTSE